MMKYRKDKHGDEISVLGYGCMRFSRRGTGIDLQKTEQEILEAVSLGVNYFDTAYIYPGSEETLGTILERNGLRDKVKIATKLPQYLIGSAGALDRYFEEELRRLKTDHIDYYLMHMLTDIQAWNKLKRLGIEDWIREKKASGEIRNIGFSYHGNTEMFIKILEDYDWDFCQIQYNYMDEYAQAGRPGLQRAYELGIPVVIMEPLRGGKLVTLLPAEAKARIAADAKHRSATELAFAWLFDQPEVTCVLSGMNSLEMVRENCRIASETEVHSLTEEDFALYEEIRTIIRKSVKIGCTECRYCMPCPQSVAIPDLFRAYNRMYTEGKSTGRSDFMMTVALRKEPGFAEKCIRCGKCTMHCPQHLAIPDLLNQAQKEVLPPHYRIAAAVARKFINR